MGYLKAGGLCLKGVFRKPQLLALCACMLLTYYILYSVADFRSEVDRLHQSSSVVSTNLLSRNLTKETTTTLTETVAKQRINAAHGTASAKVDKTSGSILGIDKLKETLSNYLKLAKTEVTDANVDTVAKDDAEDRTTLTVAQVIRSMLVTATPKTTAPPPTTIKVAAIKTTPKMVKTIPKLDQSNVLVNTTEKDFIKMIQRPKEPVKVTPELLEQFKSVRDRMAPDQVLSKPKYPEDATYCPLMPHNLSGRVNISQKPRSFDEIIAAHPDIKPGGRWYPKACKARDRVAILIPYKDRDPHLRALLDRLHTMLPTQQLDYAIFVIELVDNQTFNRGKLLNVGLLEAMGRYDFDCAVFHDVDLIPEDDRNIYFCPSFPRHNANAIDRSNYKMPYGGFFGGVSTMTIEQMVKMNGFSNDFWGWGGEDDDVGSRVWWAGYHPIRLPAHITRYTAMKHTRDKANPVNPCRVKILRASKSRYHRDGLNTTAYSVKFVGLLPTHTRIRVDLLEKESKAALDKENLCK